MRSPALAGSFEIQFCSDETKPSLSYSFTLGLTHLAAQADNITGVWLTGEGNSQVRIYKATDGKYYGKIVWLNEPFNVDGTQGLITKTPMLLCKITRFLI